MNRTILILTIVLLAGCTDPAPDTGPEDGPSTAPATTNPPTTTAPAPTTAPQVEPAPALVDKAPQWLDCTERLLAVDVEDASLSSALPEGLEANGLFPGYWTAWTHVFSCGSFIIDNETVIRDANLVIFTADVIPSSSLQRPGAFHEFILAAWADDERIVEAYSDDGFPMRGLATIDFEQTATGTILGLTTDESTVFTFTSPTGTETHNPSGPQQLRMFFMDDQLRWMDLDFDDVEAYLIEDQGVIAYKGAPYAHYTGKDEDTVPGASHGADTYGIVSTVFGA